MKNEIILYQTDDLAEHIEVRLEDETVWLTQAQMAMLFDQTKQNISLHINNCFKEKELELNSVVKESLTTAKDGKKYKTKFYNLDVIISVGYQIFDAYELASRIIRSAKKEIILIDNYIDESTITHLSKKEENVKVLLLTKSISKTLALDVKKAKEQYAHFEANELTTSHDRFLIIDQKELYHLGASLKDLGKKWFAFSKLDGNILEMMLVQMKKEVAI